MNHRPSLAAIHCVKDLPVDHFLVDVVARARDEGLRVTGFLQYRGAKTDECCRTISVENIDSGEVRLISQPLGAGSAGCRLDPAALADIAGELLVELDMPTDLLVVNRFGKGECEGHGLRAVIETAFARGVPVLTIVRDTYADGWRDFAGHFGVLLAADQQSVTDWFDEHISRRTRVLQDSF
ncbi:hypothetical protein QBD01_003512 [Ochrobactrum sp. 19YEA23]|uniref:DUF2478 domain-containing protein n=1 Tax=Ochrobactrum sp. 19YEA23 TaxID=3039854 RepID=UPI002479F12D|nr:hypothetical protein [Ochrobactrum sp. 19YEA23]